MLRRVIHLTWSSVQIGKSRLYIYFNVYFTWIGDITVTLFQFVFEEANTSMKLHRTISIKEKKHISNIHNCGVDFPCYIHVLHCYVWYFIIEDVYYRVMTTLGHTMSYMKYFSTLRCMHLMICIYYEFYMNREPKDWILMPTLPFLT